MQGWLARIAMLCCLAASAGHAHAVTEVTVVTDDNHPPYAYVDKTGEPAGIYVEVMQQVFARMPDYRVRIVAAPWKRALRMAEAGEVFGIFPPHYFPGERPYLNKFSKPVLEEVPVVACSDAALKSKGISAGRGHWPEDFRALTFGVSAGVRMGGDAFWSDVGKGLIKIESAPSVRENLRKVAYGRVDCHINDRLTIAVTWQELVQDKPQLAATHLIEVAAMAAEHGYLALSRAANPVLQDDFLGKFNAALEQVQHSGGIQAAIERAMPSRMGGSGNR